MSKKSKQQELEDYQESFYDGSPCGNAECGKPKIQCSYCGRTEMRGNTVIKNRTGFVHYERLNETNKKLHNKLPPEEQKTHTIKLWIKPNLSW